MGDIFWLLSLPHHKKISSKDDSPSRFGQTNRIIYSDILSSFSRQLSNPCWNNRKFTLYSLDRHTSALHFFFLSLCKTFQIKTKIIDDSLGMHLDLWFLCSYCNSKFNKRQRKRSKRCNSHQFTLDNSLYYPFASCGAGYGNQRRYCGVLVWGMRGQHRGCLCYCLVIFEQIRDIGCSGKNGLKCFDRSFLSLYRGFLC